MSEDVITWGGSSGFQTQPLPFVIAGLVVFAFTSIGFIGLLIYFTKQIRDANSRFSAAAMRGFRVLTIGGWINVCVMPAMMMVYPAWTLRLFCIACMGIYFLYFLYHNFRAKMQLVDPYIVTELEKVVKEEIKPAMEALPNDNSEQVVSWAKDATDKLDALIARLRGKDDASGTAGSG